MNIAIPGTKFTLDEAIAWLEFCCNEYYNFGSSPVSDLEYDYVIVCVKKVVPNHPFFTQKIRSMPLKNKVQLKNTVYSLDKIDVIQDRTTGAFDLDGTFAGLQSWMAKLRLKFGELKLYCSPKGDGLTGILYYEKGKLVLASTGGDGQEGQDMPAGRTKRSRPDHRCGKKFREQALMKRYLRFQERRIFRQPIVATKHKPCLVWLM